MKLKPKGRKIYRQKSRFERLRAFRSNTGAIVSLLLFIGILGFIGYSAGGPVLRFLQQRNILPVPGQETAATEPPTEIILPPEETTLSLAADESSLVMEDVLDTEEPATTEPLPAVAPEAPEFRGYTLSISALSGEAALEAALGMVPEDATHILIPLKTSGGSLYYATVLEDAGKNGAVKAAMPLERIYEMTAASGAEPVAVVNTLEDHVYPANFGLAAYRIAGSETVWASEEDGKPWLSPFSDLTLEYMSKLAGEIAQAGFTSILCEGLRFPVFSEADLEKLDPRCSSADRYMALVKVVKTMQDAAPETAFYVRVDGMEVLRNQSDTLIASEKLELEALLVTINAATESNSDLLRAMSLVHPSILEWNGVSMPADEKSFVLPAPSVAEET